MHSQKIQWMAAVVWLSAPASSFANTASLRLQNSQYISSATNFYRDDASSNNSSLSLRLTQDKRWRKNFGTKLDIKDEYSATENWNYLNIYQSHLHMRMPYAVALSAGRKIEVWSTGEEDWKLGIFQPRYMQNKLRPETAGLSGFLFSSSVKSYVWTVGVLPLFVPDLGAHHWIDNHRFASKNPWFDAPAPTYRFRDTNNDIRYSTNKPSVGKVLFNPGLSAKVENSGSQLGTRLSAAYKPVPQLLFGFPSLNRVVVGSPGDYLAIEVTPKVVYHWIASVDAWRRLGEWNLTGGVSHDHPLRDKFNDGWTSQTFSPAWIVTLSASRPLETEGANAARVKLGLVKIAGGLGGDQGVFASERSLFEGRFQYSEAYMAGFMLPVRGFLRSTIETEAKIIYDRLQNGGVVSVSAGYNLNRDWRVDGELDVLGLVSGRAANETGFFSSYRANDRVGMGMSYVF